MVVLLDTFQLSFATVLTMMNSAIGLLLSISMFGFPLLGWAAATAVIAGLVSLLGGADDDDDDEIDPNAEYRFAPDGEEYEDEGIPAELIPDIETWNDLEDEIKKEEAAYIVRRRAQLRASTIKRVAAARVRNRERGGKRYD